MTRMLITGMSGLLGINLALLARDRYQTVGSFCQHPVVVPGVFGLWADLLRPGAAEELIVQIRPNVIIHTVGLTSVDACERDPELARRLNIEVASEVARLAGSRGAKLVYISSDHLFDGSRPWHTEDEPLAPVNAYAATKAEAERLVRAACPDALIIRTNFYGWGSSVRRSLSDWILEGVREGRKLRMFRDVHFTPMLINDLAGTIFELLDRDVAGVYHVCGTDRLSKLEFACALTEVFEVDRWCVIPSALDEAGLAAPRPRDMSLSTEKVARLLGRRMPGVREGLRRLRQLENEGWPGLVAGALQTSGVSGRR